MSFSRKWERPPVHPEGSGQIPAVQQALVKPDRRSGSDGDLAHKD